MTVEQFPMVDRHACDPADELEVVEVLLVADAAVGVYLQRVVVHGGVLEQPVVRIEHLLRQQEEPLPSEAAIIWNTTSFNYHFISIPLLSNFFEKRGKNQRMLSPSSIIRLPFHSIPVLSNFFKKRGKNQRMLSPTSIIRLPFPSLPLLSNFFKKMGKNQRMLFPSSIIRLPFPIYTPLVKFL